VPLSLSRCGYSYLGGWGTRLPLLAVSERSTGSALINAPTFDRSSSLASPRARSAEAARVKAMSEKGPLEVVLCPVLALSGQFRRPRVCPLLELTADISGADG
jgi:hypothetical protein